METSLFEILWKHVEATPFDGIATLIFICAITHTFFAAKLKEAAHRQQKIYKETGGEGDSIKASFLEFFGEVEVIFGLWIIPLLIVMQSFYGWQSVITYMDDRVAYTEAVFVGVIMTIASSRPILNFSEKILEQVARLGGGTPGAWWMVLLTLAPLLGSLITEPAAMTIAALLLAKYFYIHQPSTALKYGTIGLLFVNISIGGTLTHFAAPPIVMVVEPWNWTLSHVFVQIGLKSIVGIVVSTGLYFLFFRKEFKRLKASGATQKKVSASTPSWIIGVHILFLIWTVVNLHSMPLCVGGFLFFLGFVKATFRYQAGLNLMNPVLVSFFLAGLVTHGTLQGWWLEPVLSRLSEIPLFLGATVLTAFNDNAAITFLATLVPVFGQNALLQQAVVQGAVTGGGLTVIANAPNPAGQSILAKFFHDGVHPLYLFLGALVPTLIIGSIFVLSL